MDKILYHDQCTFIYHDINTHMTLILIHMVHLNKNNNNILLKSNITMQLLIDLQHYRLAIPGDTKGLATTVCRLILYNLLLNR